MWRPDPDRHSRRVAADDPSCRTKMQATRAFTGDEPYAEDLARESALSRLLALVRRIMTGRSSGRGAGK